MDWTCILVFIFMIRIILQYEVTAQEECEVPFNFTKGTYHNIILKNVGIYMDRMVPIREGSRYLYAQRLSTASHSSVAGQKGAFRIPSTTYNPEEDVPGLCEELGLSSVVLEDIEEWIDLKEQLLELHNRLVKNWTGFSHQTMGGPIFPLGGVRDKADIWRRLDKDGNIPFQMLDFHNVPAFWNHHEFYERYFLGLYCFFKYFPTPNGKVYRWQCITDMVSTSSLVNPLCQYKDTSSCFVDSKREHSISTTFVEIGRSNKRVYFGAQKQENFTRALESCMSMGYQLLDFGIGYNTEKDTIEKVLTKYHETVAYGNGTIYSYTAIKLDPVDTRPTYAKNPHNYKRPFTWLSSNIRQNATDIPRPWVWDMMYPYFAIIDKKCIHQLHDCVVIRDSHELRPIHCSRPAYYICQKDIDTTVTTKPALTTRKPIPTTKKPQHSTLKPQPSTVSPLASTIKPAISIRPDETLDCACGVANAVKGRVVGGSQVEPYQYPWVVLVQPAYKQYHDITPSNHKICGGSIINDRIIITSAQCVFDEKIVHASGSEMGDAMAQYLNLSVHRHGLRGKENSLELQSNTIIPHPLFFAGFKKDQRSADNDLAIIVLDEPLDFNWRSEQDNTAINPICVPKAEDHFNYAGRLATVVGWGVTKKSKENYKKYAARLRQYQGEIKNINECKKWKNHLKNERYITKHFLCMSNDTAFPGLGDGGGPIAVSTVSMKWFQLGVLSWYTDVFEKPYEVGGTQQGNKNVGRISLYTDMSKHLEFIESESQKHNAKWCSQ